MSGEKGFEDVKAAMGCFGKFEDVEEAFSHMVLEAR